MEFQRHETTNIIYCTYTQQICAQVSNSGAYLVVMTDKQNKLCRTTYVQYICVPVQTQLCSSIQEMLSAVALGMGSRGVLGL